MLQDSCLEETWCKCWRTGGLISPEDGRVRLSDRRWDFVLLLGIIEVVNPVKPGWKPTLGIFDQCVPYAYSKRRLAWASTLKPRDRRGCGCCKVVTNLNQLKGTRGFTKSNQEWMFESNQDLNKQLKTGSIQTRTFSISRWQVNYRRSLTGKLVSLSIGGDSF